MKLRPVGSLAALAAAVFLSNCSNETARTPLTPNSGNPWRNTELARSASRSQPASGVQIMAAGDVQNGPIEIREVRIRRGPSGSQADVSPNALAGSVVRVPSLGQEVELWVTWSSSSTLAAPPRLVIDFGDGFVDNISCGSCLLRHAYNSEGRFTVKVLMDDRAGGITTRTFTLELVGARCGTSVSTNFDAFGFGAPGAALAIPGVSFPGATEITGAFAANMSGGALIAFIGDGDIDMTFTDPQASIQFEYAYQAGFPGTMTVVQNGVEKVSPLVGVSDGIISEIGHISLGAANGITRVVLSNGSNGVMIDKLSTTAACLF